MNEQKFIIKNMTCNSCIELVKNELDSLGFEIISLKLGEVKVINVKKVNEDTIREALQKHSFDLVNNYEEEIVEKTRLAILDLVNRKAGIEGEIKYTIYLEKRIGRTYKYLSKLFSKYRKTSIERFLILAKIEKAKELIQYGELTFSEIAYHLGYNNLQHLSVQFKKIAGCTMSDCKEKHVAKRIAMNEI